MFLSRGESLLLFLPMRKHNEPWITSQIKSFLWNASPLSPRASAPVSRDRDFYHQALRQRGFQITDTTSTDNKTRFEAEKNGQRIALKVQFDENTGKSTDVDVASLMGTKKDSSQMSKKQESQQDDHMVQR
jgi:hypothetical protein